MPEQDPRINEQTDISQFAMNVTVFGPIRPSPDLHRQTQRSLKAHSSGRDFFTDITLHENRNSPGMRVEYTVTAQSPQGAVRAGAVYLSQLCDLLAVVTRSPVWFYMPDEDSSEERSRMHRRITTVDRILTVTEWSWVTGNLVYLRREHPRFLAAASWYRKGLIGRDALDDLCCYWRVIERIAYSYTDKTSWSDSDREKSRVKQCVEQLATDLFHDCPRPDVLATDHVSKVIKLRNDISHGNIPITLEVIDAASDYLKPLEAAAFAVLDKLRQTVLVCQEPA